MAESKRSLIEDQEREALRAQHQVRPLTEPEDGCGLPWLPDGVYGYTCAVGQRDAPLFSKRIEQGFEVHKRLDGSVHLVGYVSPEDASQMNTVEESARIHLFPDPHEGANTLVSVPLSRVLRHKEHSQRMESGLELELVSED